MSSIAGVTASDGFWSSISNGFVPYSLSLIFINSGLSYNLSSASDSGTESLRNAVANFSWSFWFLELISLESICRLKENGIFNGWGRSSFWATLVTKTADFGEIGFSSVGDVALLTDFCTETSRTFSLEWSPDFLSFISISSLVTNSVLSTWWNSAVFLALDFSDLSLLVMSETTESLFLFIDSTMM